MVARRELFELSVAQYGHLQQIAGPEAAQRFLYALVSGPFDVDLDSKNFNDDVSADEEFLVPDLCGDAAWSQSEARGDIIANRSLMRM